MLASRLVIALILLSPITCLGQPVQEATPVPDRMARSIEDYVQLGLQQNPAISAAYYRVESLRRAIPQAWSLPDPRLQTTTWLAPVQTAAGEQQFGLGIQQTFTDRDRRATRAAIARAEVQAALAELERVRQETAERIRNACYQLLYIRRAIGVTREDIASLEQIAEVVRGQYEIRQAVSQQDVLNIEIEQKRADNQLVEWQQQEKSARAKLARLVGIPSESAFEIDDSLTLSTVNFDLEGLVSQAIQARPELAEQLAQLSREQRKVGLACLQNRPDFTVGLNWIATSSDGISPVANGDDAVLLNIGFNLPVDKNRIRAAVDEARFSKQAAVSQYESLKDQVVEEIHDLYAEADSVRQILQLLQQDIIPRATQTLDLSIDEYANADVSYVQLIENWRQLLQYRITEARLIAQYNQMVATLTRSVGQVPLLNGGEVDTAAGSFNQ